MNHILKNISLYINFFLLLALNFVAIVNIPLLSSLAGFIYLFIVPGLLVYKIINVNKQGFWYNTLNIVGLSLLFIMFVGLFGNMTGNLLGISRPLSSIKISGLFTLVMFVMLYCSKDKEFKLFDLNKINYEFLRSIPKYVLLFLLPVLAIAGATIINNGGASTVTIVLILIISTLSIYILHKSERLSEDYILSCIYFISLTLLLMTSMRGNHLIGYDVHKELKVFEITQKMFYWSMSNLQDAYNACLSITILPTITSGFISLSNEYIYKFLMQIIFALMPAGLYLLIRNFGEKKIAMLATFFCLFQTWFFQNMPALIRQENAILFFVLIFLIIFDKTLDKKKQFILACMFGLGMILSHYSTSYIAIILLFGAYVANYFSFYLSKITQKFSFELKITNSIKFSYIIFLVLAVLVWGKYFTHTSKNINEFISMSSTGASKIFTSDSLVHTMNLILYPPKVKTDLGSYIEVETKIFKENHPQFQYYDNPEISNLRSEKFIEVPTSGGVFLHKLSLSIFKYSKIIVNDLFIVFGIFYMLYLWLRGRNDQSEYVIMAIMGMVFVFLLIVIPGALHEYNIERLYFQLLTVWAFFGVVGGINILKNIFSEKTSINIITGIYVLIFFFYSGLIFSFTGGPAIVSLHSYGEDYEKFYSSSQEAQAAGWLAQTYDGVPIFTNSAGINKLNAYSLIPIKDIYNETLPTVIPKRSFVFLTHINTIGGIAMYEYNGSEYAYTYPKDFLSKNKNKIYTNGISEIYR